MIWKYWNRNVQNKVFQTKHHQKFLDDKVATYLVAFNTMFLISDKHGVTRSYS